MEDKIAFICCMLLRQRGDREKERDKEKEGERWGRKSEIETQRQTSY